MPHTRSARHKIVIEEGFPYEDTVTLTLAGETPDLTNFTNRMVIRYDTNGSTMGLGDGSGLTASADTSKITLSRAQTALLKDGVFYLETTDSDGVVYRLLSGGVEVSLNAGV